MRKLRLCQHQTWDAQNISFMIWASKYYHCWWTYAVNCFFLGGIRCIQSSWAWNGRGCTQFVQKAGWVENYHPIPAFLYFFLDRLYFVSIINLIYVFIVIIAIIIIINAVIISIIFWILLILWISFLSQETLNTCMVLTASRLRQYHHHHCHDLASVNIFTGVPWLENV